MINYETILSNYNDKLTLMQWLKKVETALAAAALASVTITQPTEDTAIFNFEFADGTSVASPSLNLPRGPQGEQGEQGAQGVQGVGVSNVAINSNSHLIVTLTNGVEIDAGYIETGSGVVVDTELSPTSTNPVENRVIYNAVTANANNITALGGRVTDVETDIETLDESVTGLSGRMTTAEGDLTALTTRVSAAEGDIVTLQNDKLEEVTAGDVNSEAATSGQVLTANGSGGASWQTPQSGGGGTQLYKHAFTFTMQDGTHEIFGEIICASNTQITNATTLSDVQQTLVYSFASYRLVGETSPLVYTVNSKINYGGAIIFGGVVTIYGTPNAVEQSYQTNSQIATYNDVVTAL